MANEEQLASDPHRPAFGGSPPPAGGGREGVDYGK
jgi:hypothetical protein